MADWHLLLHHLFIVNFTCLNYGSEMGNYMQTPILWSHGMDDRTVLFEAGQAGPPFVEQAGVSCEFKVLAYHPFLKHPHDFPMRCPETEKTNGITFFRLILVLVTQ